MPALNKMQVLCVFLAFLGFAKCQDFPSKYKTVNVNYCAKIPDNVNSDTSHEWTEELQGAMSLQTTVQYCRCLILQSHLQGAALSHTRHYSRVHYGYSVPYMAQHFDTLQYFMSRLDVFWEKNGKTFNT